MTSRLSWDRWLVVRSLIKLAGGGVLNQLAYLDYFCVDNPAVSQGAQRC